MTSLVPPPTDTSPRFREKRDRILDAASDLINDHGLKGLTFVKVAAAVDLNTTSVTYYFKRKELLAAATFERAILRLDTIAAEAGQAPDPRARVEALFTLHFDLTARIRRGEAHPNTLLSELRALNDPLRGELIALYQSMRERVADYFGPARDDEARARDLARAHVVLDIMHWARAWTPAYSIADFPRVKAQLMALFDHGLALPGATWPPDLLDPDTIYRESDEVGREAYLRAATQLLNERGYRGASVESIAARLNLSKGSFYRHLEGKDDLVMDCFARSYARVTRTQRLAMEADGTWWDRLAAGIATLLHIQFHARFPLLRSIAMQALPPEARPEVLLLSNRMAQRFGGMMFDGMAEGSVRHIDPFIASQCLMASLNAAVDLHAWAAARPSRDEAVRIYAAPFVHGLFSD